MIREAQSSDLPAILDLWIESTTWGHPFIDEQYWHDSLQVVRDVYLSNAITSIWEEKGEFLGFVSIIEDRFLAAMFVAPKAARRGIGRALMQHVQQRYPFLILEVYQENLQALRFYMAQGFRVIDSAWQEQTQHPTWIMSWQVDQTP